VSSADKAAAPGAGAGATPPAPAPPTASAAGVGAPTAPTSPAAEPSTAAAPSSAAQSSEPAHAGSGDKTHAETASSKTTRPAKHTEPRRPEHRAEVAAAPKSDKRPRGRSVQDVKSEANGLYRSKNFSGAAVAIKSSLSGFSGYDAKELASVAEIYSQLGKAYAVGMGPGTKPVEAYLSLVRANNLDREVGGACAQELHDKLVAVAPRAATSYMAAKSFEQAFEAVSTAEALGSRSDDLKIVRQNLVDKAKELLHTAHSELASDPEAAKQKAHQVQAIVDRQSPLWQQAARLLSAP